MDLRDDVGWRGRVLIYGVLLVCAVGIVIFGR